MLVTMSMRASLFVLHLLFRTSASTSLASQPDKGPKEVDIAVQAETSETVIEFCNGRGCRFVGQVTSMYYHIKCQARRVENMGGEKKMKEIAKKFYKIKDLHLQQMHRHYLRTNDPKWSEMWALNGAVWPSLKVTEAWRLGYSGHGITIAVVDDGLQADHPDLTKRFDLFHSFDYRVLSGPLETSESHGTQVAGLIAAEANNSVCIVGVAYDCTVLDVRLIGGEQNDIMEAKALRHYLKGVDIYSNSWGPVDKILYKNMGPVAESAVIDGVTLGRNGKGAIYLFAAGNGGPQDNCNSDGYVNSIYTIPITSIGVDGKATHYSEVCAPVFAAIYSGTPERNLTSTYKDSNCDGGLEGTSFSTPQASGIVALTIQANPSLTWRDIQHLIVQTSKRYNIEDGFEKQSWQKNGAGFQVSQVVGFGLMDAEAMVTRAESWTLVRPQVTCLTETKTVDLPLPGNFYDIYDTPAQSLPTTSSITETGKQCSISSLEHVQAEVYLTYTSRRGDVSLTLTSPSGTVSYLMTPRPLDSTLTEFESGTLIWKFTSVHFWGENIRGTWKLTMTMERESYIYTSSAYVKSWKLFFYGTSNATTDKTDFKEKQTLKVDVNKDMNIETTVDFWNIGGNQDLITPANGKQTDMSPRSSGISVGEYAIIVLSAVILGFISLCCLLYRRHIRTRNPGNTINRPRIFVTQLNNYNRMG